MEFLELMAQHLLRAVWITCKSIILKFSTSSGFSVIQTLGKYFNPIFHFTAITDPLYENIKQDILRRYSMNEKSGSKQTNFERTWICTEKFTIQN